SSDLQAGAGRLGRRLSRLWRPSEFFFDQLTQLFIIIVGKRSAPLGRTQGRTMVSREEDAEDAGFAQFEQFLDAWSRRDFLKRAGGAAAYMASLGGAVECLVACAGGTTTTTTTPKSGV